MKNHNGFSLVELLIVVAILGILAAIAIPNLLAARRSANEGSAISDLRMFHGAQMTYASSIGMGAYAGNIGSIVNAEPFAQLGAAGIIDNLLAGATKNGYNFTGSKVDATPTLAASFCGRAIPIVGSGIYATGPRNIAIATAGVMNAAPAEDENNANCTLTAGYVIVTSASPIGN